MGDVTCADGGRAGQHECDLPWVCVYGRSWDTQLHRADKRVNDFMVVAVEVDDAFVFVDFDVVDLLFWATVK